MNYLIDTYGWIEYLNGSKKGEVIRDLINDSGNKIVVMECCIAEMITYSLREGKDYERALEIIKNDSIILPITIDTWIKAAKIKHDFGKKKKHFGLIDAILVAKQTELKCKIVSGDFHFKGIKDVIYI